MVYQPPTHCILTPLLMVYRHPTHGILTPYPWYIYIDPPIHGILIPYPWYIDPLSMVFLPPAYLLIRNEGGQNTMGVQFTIQVGQYTIWHRPFLHSWTITGFVIRLTRRVPLVEKEQLTFPEHPSSVPVFSGVCVTRSLVYVYALLIIVCPFVLFCHCVVRPSIYGFWLPLSALVSWNSS
jgi:hypothetical protein